MCVQRLKQLFHINLRDIALLVSSKVENFASFNFNFSLISVTICKMFILNICNSKSQFSDHLSQAFANLEHRLLNEVNHLRGMINLLLPPLYQQHYFAQPKPQLYQPILPHSTTSLNSANDSKSSNASDQLQNGSPTNISSAIDSTTASIDKFNVSQVTTVPMEEDATAAVTEKQLQFKPVQKKTGDRFRQSQSRCNWNESNLHDSSQIWWLCSSNILFSEQKLDPVNSKFINSIIPSFPEQIYKFTRTTGRSSSFPRSWHRMWPHWPVQYFPSPVFIYRLKHHSITCIAIISTCNSNTSMPPAGWRDRASFWIREIYSKRLNQKLHSNIKS